MNSQNIQEPKFEWTKEKAQAFLSDQYEPYKKALGEINFDDLDSGKADCVRSAVNLILGMKEASLPLNGLAVEVLSNPVQINAADERLSGMFSGAPYQDKADAIEEDLLDEVRKIQSAADFLEVPYAKTIIPTLEIPTLGGN